MSFLAMCVVALVAIGEEQPRSAIADTASEGERDLPAMIPVLKKFVVAQPYGKTWLELAKTEPALKDTTGLGEAKTHDHLKNDPMETHQQAQYIAPTDTVLRYGVVVIRGERVFKYGKLGAVRLTMEPAGKAARELFVADVAAIASAWEQPATALQVDALFRVSKNDLVDQKKKKPDCTDVSFDERGVVDESVEGVNQVVFEPTNWRYARDAVALTRTTYGTEDGIIRSATIEVNEAIFDFVDASAGCSTQMPAYDITAVLTHEVGHLLGLDHTRFFNHNPADPTMAPEVGPCEMDKRSIEPDDIEGLCLLYPVGEPPGRCERIPAQADPYVANRPFGCTANGGSGSPFAFLVITAAFFLIRRRRLLG